jgi:hypothetical protein
MQKQNEECCPRFNPEQWDNKILEWDNKRFIKDKVRSFMFIPLNFGQVMKRLDSKIRNADAETQDYMCLSDHTPKWKMNVYCAVDKEVPGAENITLSGKFLTKVYEGNFKQTGEWCKDFKDFAKSKSLTVKKWYMWYTTCPKCAKKYGGNYVVVVGQV